MFVCVVVVNMRRAGAFAELEKKVTPTDVEVRRLYVSLFHQNIVIVVQPFAMFVLKVSHGNNAFGLVL